MRSQRRHDAGHGLYANRRHDTAVQRADQRGDELDQRTGLDVLHDPDPIEHHVGSNHPRRPHDDCCSTLEQTTTSITSSTTSSAPDQPEQSIPRAVQGTWRISDGDTVTAEQCATNSNFGQVLTVRADGYNFFEAGGVLIEVIERDESRIDAMFETTAGGPNTRVERITLDAQDAGNVLILNDAQPGVIRLVRCPPAGGSAATGGDPEPLELQPFDLARVREAGIESIGCTVRLNEANDRDPVFFANGGGGFMVIDGESIALANSTSTDLGVIPDLEADLTFSQNGYAATFVTVGPAEPISIESTEQDVTLAVATPDGRRTRINGIALCGV